MIPPMSQDALRLREPLGEQPRSYGGRTNRQLSWAGPKEGRHRLLRRMREGVGKSLLRMRQRLQHQGAPDAAIELDEARRRFRVRWRRREVGPGRASRSDADVGRLAAID